MMRCYISVHGVCNDFRFFYLFIFSCKGERKDTTPKKVVFPHFNCSNWTMLLKLWLFIKFCAAWCTITPTIWTGYYALRSDSIGRWSLCRNCRIFGCWSFIFMKMTTLKRDKMWYVVRLIRYVFKDILNITISLSQTLVTIQKPNIPNWKPL